MKKMLSKMTHWNVRHLEGIEMQKVKVKLKGSGAGLTFLKPVVSCLRTGLSKALGCPHTLWTDRVSYKCTTSSGLY